MADISITENQMLEIDLECCKHNDVFNNDYFNLIVRAPNVISWADDSDTSIVSNEPIGIVKYNGKDHDVYHIPRNDFLRALKALYKFYFKD